MNAAHTIESAVFEITLDPALLPWPDLATDIEAQLLPVVERVFDATEGGFTLDTLEIDLSVTRFNGSWRGLRDRLSDALRNALQKHRPLVAAATGPMTAGAADLARDAPQEAPFFLEQPQLRRRSVCAPSSTTAMFFTANSAEISCAKSCPSFRPTGISSRRTRRNTTPTRSSSSTRI